MAISLAQDTFFPSPAKAAGGTGLVLDFAYDGTRMWTFDNGNALVYEMSVDGAIDARSWYPVDALTGSTPAFTTANAFGMAWDGTNLIWMARALSAEYSGYRTFFYTTTRDGARVGEPSFIDNVYTSAKVSWNGTHFVVLGRDATDFYVDQYNPDFSLVSHRVAPRDTGLEIAGMEAVGDYLYLMETDWNTVHKLRRYDLATLAFDVEANVLLSEALAYPLALGFAGDDVFTFDDFTSDIYRFTLTDDTPAEPVGAGGIFFFPHNRYEHLLEPQFTRVRHRYRGPRESEKFNLEIHQMTYSLYRLYRQFDAIHERYLESIGIAIDGGAVRDPGVLDEAGVALTITGLDDLITHVQHLDQRIKVLEQS